MRNPGVEGGVVVGDKLCQFPLIVGEISIGRKMEDPICVSRTARPKNLI
jgi:hypothetical protein